MFERDETHPLFRFDELDSFFEFISIVSNQWDEVWFRGHSNGSHPLEPKIMRKDAYLLAEHSISRDFVRRATNFFGDLKANNYSRWLFLMQHYGIPTRLLDWTESLPVALYFAFGSKEMEPPCLWILNPIALNELAINENAIPHENTPDVQNYCRSAFSLVVDHRKEVGDLPIAILPHYFDQRLVAQRAAFTVHGNIPEPLDALLMQRAEAKLSRLLIRAEFSERKLPRIRKQLEQMLPKKAQMFPDIGGLVAELSDYYLSTANVD